MCWSTGCDRPAHRLQRRRRRLFCWRRENAAGVSGWPTALWAGYSPASRPAECTKQQYGEAHPPRQRLAMRRPPFWVSLPARIMKNSAAPRLARMARKRKYHQNDHGETLSSDCAAPCAPDFRFWLVTAAAMAAMAATAALGRWQLDRAAQRKPHSAIVTRMQLPPWRPVPLSDCWPLRRVICCTVGWRCAGNGWPGIPCFWTIGKCRGGRVSSWSRRCSSRKCCRRPGAAWLGAAQFSGPHGLAAGGHARGLVELHGRVAALLRACWSSKGAAAQRGLPHPAKSDLEAFRTETGLPLADVSVLQTDAESGGLLRQWLYSVPGSRRTTVTPFNGSGFAA